MNTPLSPDFSNLFNRTHHWVFDMDGTLTIHKHDFMGMREALGVRLDQPILESIAELPEAEAQRIRESLHKIELEVAHQTEVAEGATELLDRLIDRGDQIGILTRNNLINAEVTLAAAGLTNYFPETVIIGRDCEPPKPSPKGIQRLQQHWGCEFTSMAMVGDSIFDLQAGRHAGVTTLYIDPAGEFEHRHLADHCLTSLQEFFI